MDYTDDFRQVMILTGMPDGGKTRQDSPLHYGWCTRHADEGWMDIYNNPRFTTAAIKTGVHKAVFLVPDHRELEIHQWCVDETSGRWGTFPDTKSRVKFFFDTEADIMLFVLRFADDQFERLE